MSKLFLFSMVQKLNVLSCILKISFLMLRHAHPSVIRNWCFGRQTIFLTMMIIKKEISTKYYRISHKNKMFSFLLSFPLIELKYQRQPLRKLMKNVGGSIWWPTIAALWGLPKNDCDALHACTDMQTVNSKQNVCRHTGTSLQLK